MGCMSSTILATFILEIILDSHCTDIFIYRFTCGCPTSPCYTRGRPAQDTIGGWPGFLHCSSWWSPFFFIFVFFNWNETLFLWFIGLEAGSGSSLTPQSFTTGRDSLPFFIFISNHASCTWLCLFESKSFTLIGCLDRLKNWRLNWIPFLPAVPHDLTASWRSIMFCLTESTLTLFWMLNRWTIKTIFTLIFNNRKPNIWGKLWLA